MGLPVAAALVGGERPTLLIWLGILLGLPGIEPLQGHGVGAGAVADGVVLVLALHQVEGEGLEHPSALGEGHPAQGRTADGAGVVEHGGEVQTTAGSLCYNFPCTRVEQFCLFPATRDPLTAGVVL